MHSSNINENELISRIRRYIIILQKKLNFWAQISYEDNLSAFDEEYLTGILIGYLVKELNYSKYIPTQRNAH